MKRSHHYPKISSFIICLVLLFSVLNQNVYASKKGLQGVESVGLYTKHTLYNLIITEYINTSGGVGYESIGTFTANGSTRTYYLNTVGLSNLATMFKNARNSSEIETLSVVILARKMTGITDTTSSASPYYAFNTWTEEGVKLNTKLFSLIGQCLGSSVDYFIMQNEVNNPHSWMEMGDRTLDEYVTYYEKACRLMNNGIKAVNSNAKVMISLDYFWTNTDGGRYSAPEFLTAFAAKAKDGGDYNWGLAHHTYPCPLTDASFTDDGSLGLSNSESTNMISIYNLQVLADYFKKSNMLYNGTVRDIIISESGFNANSSGKIDEEKQAAMYAYAYYKVESIPEIKAFIIRAYVDLSPEPEQGLYFGMYDKNHHAREISDLMKYIDTQQGVLLTNKYLKYFNVSSWNQLISGYDSISFSQSKFAVGLSNDYGTAIGSGQVVTWTAEASGGTAPYQYKFVFVDPSYNETVLLDYSTSNTLETGLYITADSHIRVEVKDAKGKTTSRTIWIKYDKTNDSRRYGDINADGKFNSTDLAYMTSHMLYKNRLTGSALEAADISGDGTVNSVDLAYLTSYILGKITDLPR